MLVVADSTPLNILVRIEAVFVLEHLFRQVLIPPEVFAELTHANTPAPVRTFMHSQPPWLTVRRPAEQKSFPSLDRGETAAISLAIELHADAVLLDERAGRRIAMQEGFRVIGTLGILERAADRGLLDLADKLRLLQLTDYRIDSHNMELALRRAADRKRPPNQP